MDASQWVAIAVLAMMVFAQWWQCRVKHKVRHAVGSQGAQGDSQEGHEAQLK